MKKLPDLMTLVVGFGLLVAASILVSGPSVGAQGPPGGLAVRVVNDPLRVEDVNAVDKTPFQISLCRVIGSNPLLCNDRGPNSFSVPPDRRLVIEYVSGLCPPAGTTLPVGMNVTGALLETVAGGTTATHLFPVSAGLSIGGLNGFAVAEKTQIYADPGTSVALGIELGGLGNNSIRCTLTISGHTVVR